MVELLWSIVPFHFSFSILLINFRGPLDSIIFWLNSGSFSNSFGFSVSTWPNNISTVIFKLLGLLLTLILSWITHFGPTKTFIQLMLSNTCNMIHCNRRFIIPIHFSVFVSLSKVWPSTMIVLYLRRGESTIYVAKAWVKTLILSLLLCSLHFVFKIVLLSKIYFDMSFSRRDFCCVVLVVLVAWSVASLYLVHHALVTV